MTTMNSPLVPSVNGPLFVELGRVKPHGSAAAGSANKHRQAGAGAGGVESAGLGTPGVLGAYFLQPKRFCENTALLSKACSKCGSEKPATLDSFPADGRKRCGLRADCRVCFSAQRLKRYIAKADEAGRPYAPSEPHRVPKRSKVGAYVEQDRATERAKHRAAERRSPARMLAKRLRKRIGDAVGPMARGHYSIGCTVDDLRRHIERQFLKGMGWNNRDKWHVDHIRPLASFDLTDPEQLRSACHFTNLRPIWAEDNLRKGAKLEVLL